MHGVSDVRGPVGDRSLLRGDSLEDESVPREHGEAAVLELLDLEFLEVVLLREVEGVEASAGGDVSDRQLGEGGVNEARAEGLRSANGDDLESENSPLKCVVKG